MKKILLLCFTLVIISALSVYAAEEKPQGRPPANVVVGETVSGMLAPTSPFVGTVRFSDTSSVAAESAGKIKKVNFDVGDVVNQGAALAIIDSELLLSSLNQAKASLEQIEANLQLAKNDYERTQSLFKSNATSEQSYENKKFAAISLEKQVAAQHAAIANLKAQLEKKIVYAPYNGIVVKRNTSLGEWVNAGSVVADIAKTGSMDFIVNVPEHILKYLKKGQNISAEAAGRNITAKFETAVPTGDVGNRTFPVKLRTSDSAGLLDGMEVKVNLPSSEPTSVLFINRDAVVKARGNVFVYTVAEGSAKMIPVQVIGYEGTKAGVLSEGLKAGMKVIVKGNERIQPDQSVNIIGN
ncbi:MAG: efflux RND transporter periplasmic adaptor subunit [Denitrovibrio sp.]|nr:MAG: efflux RND transporter periplasmic adaptor subunit [Denitrovibrio sp.]